MLVLVFKKIINELLNDLQISYEDLNTFKNHNHSSKELIKLKFMLQ